MTATPKPDEGKVFDVAAPGKTVADASAKPVIVTNRTVVKDPMVTPITAEAPETAGTDMPAEPAAEGISSGKMRIEPLHADVKSEKPAETDEPQAETQPETIPSEPEPETPETPAEAPVTDEAAPAEVASDTAKDETEKDEDELDDLPSDEAKQTADKAAAARAKAEEERQAKAEALINNKQYFVPINAVKKRRSARTIGLILLVIVVLLGLLVALDAGLLKLGITPPTDFIPD